MLHVNHVTKKYQNFTALKDIDITFDYGVYGLLAPNGAGKTTLMKMLVTLLYPTEGNITYDGQEIQKMDEHYRERLGYLPQDFGYYKDYSPVKYLRYLGILKGMNRKKLASRIDEVLELVGLSEVKNKKMKQFSGGMVQRVGIAQALLNNPEILILDEPTAGLDPKERMRFRKILTSLSKDKIVLISTHIVSDVEFIANHVIMLKDKQVYCNQSTQEICRRLDGMVYETNIPENALAEWEKKYQILSQRQEGASLVIRFVCEAQDGEVVFPAQHNGSCVPCTPGLEDVFLYTFRE